MPPNNCLASSSRNSHSSRSFRNAFTAEGLRCFCTTLLERSAGWHQAMPAGSWLRIAKSNLLGVTERYTRSPHMENYTSSFGYRLGELADAFGAANMARRRALRALCAAETCWPRLRRLDELCRLQPRSGRRLSCLSVSRLFWEAATYRRAVQWRPGPLHVRSNSYLQW